MEQVTTFKAGMKYGLYLGLASTVIGLIFYFTGMQDFTSADTPILPSIAVYALVIGLTYLAIKYYKDSNEQDLSLGESMVTALYVGLISGLIGLVWTLIFFNFIDPEALDRMKELALSAPEMEDLPEEALEMTESWMSFMFSSSSMAIIAIIARLILTAIAGLVIGLILKTR